MRISFYGNPESFFDTAFLGHATADDARSHMVQSGDDVRFSHMDVNVIFENIQLDEMFVI